MVRRLTLAWAVMALSLSGCGAVAGAMLTPAAGPLFESRAGNVQVLYSGAPTGQGSLRVRMPDGEEITGQFRTMTGYSSGSPFDAGAPQADPLAVTGADWKALYGSSEMVAQQINGQIVGTGDRGTRLRGEYVTDAMSGNGYGVAKDSRGNLYRLSITAPRIY